MTTNKKKQYKKHLNTLKDRNIIELTDIIYTIDFKLIVIPTSIQTPFKYIEITSFKKETIHSKKVEIIHQLKLSLNNYNNA